MPSLLDTLRNTQRKLQDTNSTLPSSEIGQEGNERLVRNRAVLECHFPKMISTRQVQAPILTMITRGMADGIAAMTPEQIEHEFSIIRTIVNELYEINRKKPV